MSMRQYTPGRPIVPFKNIPFSDIRQLPLSVAIIHNRFAKIFLHCHGIFHCIVLNSEQDHWLDTRRDLQAALNPSIRMLIAIGIYNSDHVKSWTEWN
jgi:hypothetical protein